MVISDCSYWDYFVDVEERYYTDVDLQILKRKALAQYSSFLAISDGVSSICRW